MNELILKGIQIVSAIILIVCILLQQRGGGLSPVFGGEGSFYRTRRGVEKTVFVSTIITGVVFFTVAFLNLIF